MQQIEWLSNRLVVSATEVIERAVAEKYETEYGKLLLKAEKLPDGNYGLSVENIPVAIISESVLDKTGRFKEMMLNSGAPADAIGAVLLAGARAKNSIMEFDSDGMEKVYGKVPDPEMA